MLKFKLSQIHLYLGARRPIVKFVLFLLTISLTIFPAQGGLSAQTPNINLKYTISNQEIDLLQTWPVGENMQESQSPRILTTCTSRKTGTHYILMRTECNKRIYETRHWFIQGSAPEGTPGSVLVDLNVCSSKKKLKLSIRKTCNRSTQDSITYQRRVGQLDPPKITKVVMGTLGRASISITPPSDDGGAVITHYTVYAFPGDHKSTVLASELKSAQFTTLTPGTRYRFAVNATNNLGTSALSEQSEPILAPNVPDPPKITRLFFYGGRDAEVFVESAFDGGAPILGYSVFATVVGSNHYGNQGPFFVPSFWINAESIGVVDLPHTTTLALSLVAFNVAGNSLPSEPSQAITTKCVVDKEANLRITEGLIRGVGIPSTAGTKSTIVTAANGYSGTISWSFSQLPGTKSSLGSSFFGAMRTYIATVELVPDCPKGKIKVPANFFTVSGATSVSNAENSGVITAVFPATGPGVPNKALIVTQPLGGMIDMALATQPVVRVADIDDNTNTTYTGSITATTSGGLSGATVSAVGGIATYISLAVTSPPAGGNIQITFTPVGLIAATSNTIAISPKPKLTFTTEPSSTIARRSVFGSIILQFKTCGGGSCTSTDPTDTSITETVTASITSGSGGSLIGTVSVTAVAGVATFAKLALDGTINLPNNQGYKITFASTSFGSKESGVILLTGAQCDGSTFTCRVGDTGPAGGKIFYAVSIPFACGPSRTSSCKYLEAAPSGWNTGSDPARTWAKSTPVNYQTTSVNNPTSPETANATAIGWGYWNTRAIVGQGNTDSSTAAAALADSYSVTVSGTVYGDWFLPSDLELDQLRVSCDLVGGMTCSGGGNPNATLYWSSTELSATTARGRKMSGSNSDNSLETSNKDIATNIIRPIRSF